MSEQKDNETKPAEQKSNLLRRSEMILEISMDGFCVVGLDGKFLDVNSSLCDILGYSREELLKMNIADVDAIETPEETAQHIDKIMRQGYDRFETKHRCKDGRVIHTEVSSQYCDLDGDKFFFSFFRDITDFWLSMEKLRESHSVYETLCNNIPGMVYRARPDWSTEFIANSEAVCGYSPEDINSNKVKWSDIIHPDDREMVLNGAPKIEASRSITIQEYRIIAKDGSIHWVEDHKSPIFAKKGFFHGVDGIVFDITARRQAEKKLAESEHGLAMAQQAACVGSWDWDILNDKVTWSDETYRQFGLKPNEIEPTYEVFKGFIHPDDREQLNEAVKAAVEENKLYSIDVRMIRKDGSEWIMHAQWKIQRNDDGKVVRFVGAQQDITERKLAEQVLKESENRYRAIFQGAAEGIIVANVETMKFKYVNPSICKLLGYSQKELEQMSVTDIHTVETESSIAKFKAHAMGIKVPVIDIPCLRKDGTIIYVNINTSKMTLDGEDYLVGFFTDITEKKRQEAEHESYKEKVLDAQKRAYIGSMGSIVAHQVNQPLTKINILLDRAIEQIEDASCAPSALKNVKEGLAEAREAALIIRKFRQRSKNPALESTGKVNVSAGVDRIVSVLSEKAKQANMRISIKDLGDLPVIEANETALEQMFLILIQNAIEAADGRKPHMLDITGKFADCNIELQFSDDCCGIASENLDRIFEPFFSTKAEDEGMGLGLDIVKLILISCGGQIRVESRPGEGAAFYVTLPISNALKS